MKRDSGTITNGTMKGDKDKNKKTIEKESWASDGLSLVFTLTNKK
jgi:hypothetical protein